VFRQDLARCHGNLGLRYFHTRRFDRAEAAFRRAQELQEALVRDHPATIQFAVDLALTYAYLGDLRPEAEETEAKLGWYARAAGLPA
jgi:hypothetical protein